RSRPRQAKSWLTRRLDFRGSGLQGGVSAHRPLTPGRWADAGQPGVVRGSSSPGWPTHRSTVRSSGSRARKPPSTRRRDSMRTTPIVAGPMRPVAGADLPTVPAHALPHRSPAELLALARRGLVEAEEQRVDGLRYATAHLAALRAAAAVLAARTRP